MKALFDVWFDVWSAVLSAVARKPFEVERLQKGKLDQNFSLVAYIFISS